MFNASGVADRFQCTARLLIILSKSRLLLDIGSPRILHPRRFLDFHQVIGSPRGGLPQVRPPVRPPLLLLPRLSQLASSMCRSMVDRSAVCYVLYEILKETLSPWFKLDRASTGWQNQKGFFDTNGRNIERVLYRDAKTHFDSRFCFFFCFKIIIS